MGKKSQANELTEEWAWERERKTLYNLIHFNSLLILYNFLFVIYSAMNMNSDKYEVLITFLPIIVFVQTSILTSFTLRYYQVARVMCMFFGSDY